MYIRQGILYYIILSGRSTALTLKAQVAAYKKAIEEAIKVAIDIAVNTAAKIG
jgi:uncharacterized protein YaaR (DUF327 family)